MVGRNVARLVQTMHLIGGKLVLREDFDFPSPSLPNHDRLRSSKRPRRPCCESQGTQEMGRWEKKLDFLPMEIPDETRYRMVPVRGVSNLFVICIPSTEFQLLLMDYSWLWPFSKKAKIVIQELVSVM